MRGGGGSSSLVCLRGAGAHPPPPPSASETSGNPAYVGQYCGGIAIGCAVIALACAVSAKCGLRRAAYVASVKDKAILEDVLGAKTEACCCC